MTVILKKLVFGFLNVQGQVLVEYHLYSLPIREEQLIRKSIEFFNDPEPCMIHRSAVMQRLYAEIVDAVTGRLQNQDTVINWCDFPDHLAACIALPDPQAVCKIRIRQDR